jgi:hypothetical protein
MLYMSIPSLPHNVSNRYHEALVTVVGQGNMVCFVGPVVYLYLSPSNMLVTGLFRRSFSFHAIHVYP